MTRPSKTNGAMPPVQETHVDSVCPVRTGRNAIFTNSCFTCCKRKRAGIG